MDDEAAGDVRGFWMAVAFTVGLYLAVAAFGYACAVAGKAAMDRAERAILRGAGH